MISLALSIWNLLRFLWRYRTAVLLFVAWCVGAWFYGSSAHGPRIVECWTASGLTIAAGFVVWHLWWFIMWRAGHAKLLRQWGRTVPRLPVLVGHYLLIKLRLALVGLMWAKAVGSYPALCGPAPTHTVPRLHHRHHTIDLDVEGHAAPGAVQADADKYIELQQKLTGKMRMGIREVSIVYGKKAGDIDVRVYFTDKLDRKTTLADTPRLADPNLFALITDRRGRAVTARKDHHMMIGGGTGSGKSNQIHYLIAQLLDAGEYVVLYVSDAKGGIELPAYGDESRLGQWQMNPNGRGGIMVKAYATTAKETVAMLEKAQKDMGVRRGWMRKHSGRKMSGRPDSKARARCIVILDEALLIQPVLKKGTDSPLGDLLAGGRASWFTVWLGTQDGRYDNIPTSIRTLIPTRLCFATDHPDTTDCVLGRNAEQKGAACSKLSIMTDMGLAYAGSEDGQTYEKGRAPYVTDRQIEELVRGRVPDIMANRQLAGDTPHYLYDGINDRDEIVYVGETNDTKERFAAHLRDDWGWCPEHGQMENWWAVHVKRTEVKTVLGNGDNQRAAKQMEKARIRELTPLFNKTHNPNRHLLTPPAGLRKLLPTKRLVPARPVPVRKVGVAPLAPHEPDRHELAADAKLDQAEELLSRREAGSPGTPSSWNPYPYSHAGEPDLFDQEQDPEWMDSVGGRR